MRAREFIIEAAYDGMITSMKQKFPDQAAVIDQWVKWAKTALKKADRVTWFLKILRADLGKTLGPKELGTYQFTDLQKLAADIHHFYGIDYAPITNYNYSNQSISQVISDLTEFENDWRAEQERTRGVTPQEGDYKLIEFPDGTAWWWVGRAYCPEEGRSGKHCGNAAGVHKTEQRILSLRNKHLQVICTFILEPNGTLGEMKGVANQKPREKYHPQILKLLLLDLIKGIATPEGQYNPSANFNVFDLNDEQLIYLDQVKPVLITSQIKNNPISALTMPDSLKEKYQSVINSINPALTKLLGSATIETWESAIKEDPGLVVYAPETIKNWEDRVVSYITGTNDVLLQAPTRISKNYNIIKRIVDANPYRISEVNTNIRGYKDLALLAVQKNPVVIRNIDKEHITPDIALVAVKHKFEFIEYIPKSAMSEELYQLVKTWVIKSGTNIKHVPKDLLNAELATISAKTFTHAIFYIPSWLVNDDIAKLTALGFNDGLANLPERVVTVELAMEAMKKFGRDTFVWIKNEKFTPTIALAAVKVNAEFFEEIPQALINSELADLAIKGDVRNIRYIPKNLITSDMAKKAIDKSARYIYYIPKSLITSDMAEKVVDTNPDYIPSLPRDLITGRIAKKIANEHPDKIRYIPENEITMKAALEAVNINPNLISDVPKKLLVPKFFFRWFKDKDLSELVPKIPEKYLTDTVLKIIFKLDYYAVDYVPEELLFAELFVDTVKESPRELTIIVPRNLQSEVARLAGI